MSLHAHFVLLADYNRWMNEKLYAAAAALGSEEIVRERGAFFGSIFRTLNHLMVADLIWLRRFHAARGFRVLEALDAEEWPAPQKLDGLLFPDFAELARRRPRLDALICEWIASLSPADLEGSFDYRNTQGIPARRAFSSVLLHVFNHQTHHRGQVTTLVFQAGRDPGPTDLLLLVPDQT
jgi:uncharacterized damage-inducible protein DinB